MQSVRSSARELENANALGEAILSSIHGQRERLKVFQTLFHTFTYDLQTCMINLETHHLLINGLYGLVFCWIG